MKLFWYWQKGELLMKPSDIQELCTTINKGMYIQSFHWEREYSIEEDRMQDNLTMSFSPEINYYGEKLFKVKFFDVENLVCDSIFRMIFLCYFVDEAEGEFYFYCVDIEFWWEE